MTWLLIVALVVCIFLTASGLPGNYLMMGILALYCYLSGFALISLRAAAILVGLLIVGELLEFFAGMIGVRREKGGCGLQLLVLCGGIVGGLLGTSIFPGIGSVIGLVAGVFLTALVFLRYQGHTWDEAKQMAGRVALAQGIGTFMKVMISIVVTFLAILFLLMPDLLR